MPDRYRRGLARSDALASLVAAAAMAALLLPVFGGMGTASQRDVSANNLRTIQHGLVCYAAEWSDRQWTPIPDDLGAYGGDCGAYDDATSAWDFDVRLGWGCGGGFCQPIQDHDCDSFGVWGLYSYPPQCLRYAYEPILFEGGHHHEGSFRLLNAQPLHDTIVEAGWGRFYDPRYYAPADASAYAAAAPFFDGDCEFIVANSDEYFFIPSSYVLSPAAMLDPGVLRPESEGGFQAPGSYADGYRSPTVSQALHPAQKTWVMEHHWLYDSPGCHPTLEIPYPVDSGFGSVQGFIPDCQPYLFNGGADATALAAFFDGSVQGVRAGDVEIADAGIDRRSDSRLWSRDTPMGPDGYYGDAAIDGTRASHHILTTGGIRGRDWLGLQPRSAVPPSHDPGNAP